MTSDRDPTPLWWPVRTWPVAVGHQPPPRAHTSPGGFPPRRLALAELAGIGATGARLVANRATAGGWRVHCVLSGGWLVSATGRSVRPGRAVSVRGRRSGDRFVAVWARRDDVETWFAECAYRWRPGCCLPTRTIHSALLREDHPHDHSKPQPADRGHDARVGHTSRDPLAGVPVGVWLGSRRRVDGGAPPGGPGVETVTWLDVEPGDVIDGGGRGWRVLDVALPRARVCAVADPGQVRETDDLNPRQPVRRALAGRWDGGAIEELRLAGLNPSRVRVG
ncbi:MAG: hypothetical protein OEW44_00135 [Gemmatimonadota bacterium]|nr:hypothetical protein [Gemmatimonadota bacterium]